MLKPQSDSDWKDWLKGGSTITCDTYVNDVAINVTHSAIMRNTQGEDVSLEYLQPPSLVLPALWKADDESIERKNKGEPDAYD